MVELADTTDSKSVAFTGVGVRLPLQAPSIFLEGHFEIFFLSNNCLGEILNYIVYDLEWNQAPVKEKLIKEPVTLYGEIIQIGACKIDENNEIIDTFNKIIRPIFYKKINSRVKKITNISNATLKDGEDFKKVFSDFKKWCGEDIVFITWGDDDNKVLASNLLIHNFSDKWIPETYNLQHLFKKKITKNNIASSLTKAMEILELEDFEAHDALNDAISTAKICKSLDMVKNIPFWDSITKSSQGNDEFIKHTKELQTFLKQKKEKIIYDSEIISINSNLLNVECLTCQKVAKISGVIKNKYKKYLGIAKCENPKCDEMFVRINFKHSIYGKQLVNKKVEFLDEDNFRRYEEVKKRNIRKLEN